MSENWKAFVLVSVGLNAVLILWVGFLSYFMWSNNSKIQGNLFQMNVKTEKIQDELTKETVNRQTIDKYQQETIEGIFEKL